MTIELPIDLSLDRPMERPDAPVLRDQDTSATPDGTLDETLYFCNDANPGAPGNVTCLVDTGGDAVERYVYDPYGNCTVYNSDWSQTVAWSASKKNPIRYCGYFFDNETGLYHVRNRYYHPTLGKWLSRDPLGLGSLVFSRACSKGDVSKLPISGCTQCSGADHKEPDTLAGDFAQRVKPNLYLYGLSAPTKALDPLGLEDTVEDFVDCDHLSASQRDAITHQVGEACKCLRKALKCLQDPCCVPAGKRKLIYYTTLYGDHNAEIRRLVEIAIHEACDSDIDIECEESCDGDTNAYTRGWLWGRWANLHLCPPYFTLSVARQGNTILHEMLHYGGARDSGADDQNAHYLDNAIPLLCEVCNCPEENKQAE